MDTIACPNCSAQVVAGWPRCQRCGEPQTGRAREPAEPTFAAPPASVGALPPPLPLRERLVRPTPAKPAASILPHAGFMPVVTGVLALGCALLKLTGNEFGFAYVASYTVAIMILPLLLGWLLLFVTKRAGVAWAACLGLLFALMLLIGVGALFQEFEARRKLQRENQALIDFGSEEGRRLAEGRPAEAELIPTAEDGFSEALAVPHTDTEIRRFATALMHRTLVRTRNRTVRYQNEAAAIDLTDALTADKLANAQHLLESRRRLVAAHAMYDEYFRDLDQLNQALERDMVEHVPRTPKWDWFWSQFTPARKRRVELSRRMGANQSALYSEMEALVDLMETQLGRTSVVNDSVYFADEQAAQAFDRHTQKIALLAAEEKELLQEEQQLARQALKKLQ